MPPTGPITARDSDAWFEAAFAEVRVLAILRGLGVERSLEVARAAWAAGVRIVEAPVQSDEDLAALRALVDAAPAGCPVGAGTIVDPEQVSVVRDAGAVFTVSPGLDVDVVAASLAAGLPTVPGVATASEIQAATRLGLGWLKAFPAAQLGPDWIRAQHGPFPDVAFMATGGVTIENAPAFLAAGCRAVALGSALADPAQLDDIARLVGA